MIGSKILQENPINLPGYIRTLPALSVQFRYYTGRFMGFSCNICDPITFKVIQCNNDTHKRNVVVHRGVVVLLFLIAAG